MAGYDGFSMSNNAREAYKSGEMPMSKWTKTEILDEIESQMDNYSFTFELLKKLTAPTLRSLCLTSSSWHHTGSMFNETSFYEINDSFLMDLNDEKINIIIEREKIEKSERALEKAQKALEEPVKITRNCEFLIWCGTRKHPKAETHREVCEVKDGWAYTSKGRKSVVAKGFRYLD